MDDFRKLEARYPRTPVRLVDHDSAAGVLRLRGRRSSLSVTSAELLHPRRDPDGWYDLRVRAQDGREMLLHHALTTESGTRGWSDDKNETHYLEVFANIVIDDVRGLTTDGRVRRVQFRLRGLGQFFHYRYAELLRASRLTTEQQEILRSARYAPESADLFDPREVYVVHQFPKFISFRVEDRIYEVWAGGRHQMGLARVGATIFPVATISFDEPVSIQSALDRVWEWRRFFAQMALQPTPLKAMAVAGSLEDGARRGSVYLPNLKRRIRKVDGHYGLAARYLPLSDWDSREQLAEVMRTWLSRGEERRLFRSALDRVIDFMNHRVDPRAVVELCAAVESVPDLDERVPLPAGALEAMAAAAQKAASDAGASIGADRIKGLLGNLQRSSLSQRIARLGQLVTPAAAPADIELLAAAAVRLRNNSAHGNAMAEQLQPKVAPTIEAMAALCARFDLESCGVPSRTPYSAPSMPSYRFRDAMEELRRISHAESTATNPA